MTARGPRQAQLDDFDLHATVWVPTTTAPAWGNWVAIFPRPPLVQDRLRPRVDGRVPVQLNTVWRDDTSHFLFEPGEVFEKLAALIRPVPPP